MVRLVVAGQVNVEVAVAVDVGPGRAAHVTGCRQGRGCQVGEDVGAVIAQHQVTGAGAGHVHIQVAVVVHVHQADRRTSAHITEWPSGQDGEGTVGVGAGEGDGAVLDQSLHLGADRRIPVGLVFPGEGVLTDGKDIDIEVAVAGGVQSRSGDVPAGIHTVGVTVDGDGTGVIGDGLSGLVDFLGVRNDGALDHDDDVHVGFVPGRVHGERALDLNCLTGRSQAERLVGQHRHHHVGVAVQVVLGHEEHDLAA